MDRREFIATGIGAGFAFAVLPTASWAITTSSENLDAGEVKIPTKDGLSMPGYHARPKGKPARATILVVHEIFGVHEHIQDVARRLAAEGYDAIAPYLYFRQGDVTQLKSIDEIRPVVGKVPQSQVWSDLDSTVSFSKAKNVGITGFCWGGNVVWTYAAHNPKLKAGAAWYGKLAETGGPDPKKSPLELAPELKVPVLGLYGGKDSGIPLTDVDKMKPLLKRGSEIIVYPEAEHAFNADYRPSYNEAAAKDAWKKMLAHFRANKL